RLGQSLDDGVVPLLDLAPVLVEGLPDRVAAGEDEKAGGLAVEAMDDVEPPAELALPTEVLGELAVGGMFLFVGRGHGKEPDGLVDHGEVAVLVHDLEPPRGRGPARSRAGRVTLDPDFVAGTERLVVARRAQAVDIDRAEAQHALHLAALERGKPLEEV